MLAETGGRPQATVLGRGQKLGLTEAPLANGQMGHLLDFDDTHMGGVVLHTSSPVLALEATKVSFGAVPDSDIQVAPPAGAKVVNLGAAGATGGNDKSTPPVTGLDKVTAAAPFTVVAPDSLVGLPRQDVRLVGGKTVIAVYGQGLGAIAVVENAKDANGKPGQLDQLPAVSLDGATGHELATQLGTVLGWDRGGVSYVLAGSVPSAAAEAAARSLK